MIRRIRQHPILTILALLLLAAALFAFISAANAPAATAVKITDCGADCLQFPTVTGDSLTGQAFTLPADFAGTLNLIIMPFDQGQQVRADTWLPLARQLQSADPAFAYYNIPTLRAVNPVLRGIITSGMNMAISDASLREVTIMLFLEDKDLFFEALAIPDADNIQVFLLNAKGQLLWRSNGDYTASKGDQLRAFLAQ